MVRKAKVVTLPLFTVLFFTPSFLLLFPLNKEVIKAKEFFLIKKNILMVLQSPGFAVLPARTVQATYDEGSSKRRKEKEKREKG